MEGDPKILCFLEISLREEIAEIAVIATPVAKIAKIENLGYREQVTEDRKSKTYHGDTEAASSQPGPWRSRFLRATRALKKACARFTRV